MEKEKQIIVKKNSYWLSEIGYIFFKYQIGYEVYDYSEESNQVSDGIDLFVLNKQDIPTYIMCIGNDYPYDKIFFPISTDEQESRLFKSKADFVFIYDVKQESVTLLEIELLTQRINLHFDKYKQAVKGNSVGIQIPKNDEILKPFINEYKLNQNVSDKAKRIYDYRIKNKKLTESKFLPLFR